MTQAVSATQNAHPQTVAAKGQVAGAGPFWSGPDHPGEEYRAVLKRFHTYLQPRTYLEIGVQAGWTLELASCASIGIDPKFQLKAPVWSNKDLCLLYQLPSDAFFKRYSPTALFGGPVEMALLDGMHWFEYLLRDFINVEKHCATNSVVFLHDCLPTDTHISRRNQQESVFRDASAHPDWWAGDVWKALSILIQHRPDLRIMLFDAPPTGLVAITHLDPQSTVLSDRYFELVEAERERTLGENGRAFLRGLEIVSTRDYASASAVSACFWL